MDVGGRVLVWNPDRPGSEPVELGRGEYGVEAVAALADGRIATGNGRVLVWDPDRPGSAPVEVSRNEAKVGAVAALPDGRLAMIADGCESSVPPSPRPPHRWRAQLGVWQGQLPVVRGRSKPGQVGRELQRHVGSTWVLFSASGLGTDGTGRALSAGMSLVETSSGAPAGSGTVVRRARLMRLSRSWDAERAYRDAAAAGDRRALPPGRVGHPRQGRSVPER